MGWILGSSLRFGRLVVAVAIGLAVIAIAQLRSAPVDVYPEFMPPSVEIQTEALGLSAAEVEQLITVPLEQDLLNGVPWLDRIHSTSRPGLSAIDLTFEPGTNLYAARQMVQERMTQAHALPNVGSPPIMIQPLASASRVAMIRLSSRQVSLIDMSVLARWKIRPRLMGVRGVANVSIYGQRDRQLQVQVDPQRLRAQHVSLAQVIETAGNALWVSPLTFVEASTPGTGGFFESSSQRLSVQHISPISTPRQLSDVPVEGAKAGKLRLSDVANVVEDHQPLIGDAVAGGAPSLLLVIEKFPGADTLQVTRGIEQAMADMAPGLEGITIDTREYRPATFVETALRNAGWVALIGLALLVLALGLLGSWRAALIGAVVVPMALVLAAYVLYLRGTTFTTITLLGLAAAVGVIIDDVITDVDAVRRRLGPRATADGAEPAGATIRAAFASVLGPLVFAVLAILLATLPFLFLGTLASAFSRPLVITFALAVLTSMAVAFTLTPVLAALLLRSPGVGRPGRFAGWVTQGFDRGFAAVVGPRRAWAVAGVLVVAALAVIPQAGRGSLLPQPAAAGGGGTGHVAAGDGPHHGRCRERAAGRARGEERRNPCRPGRRFRSARRRQLRRGVDHARRPGRLRPDPGGDRHGDERLPGPANRPGHLPERPHCAGDGGPERRSRRPRLRRRPHSAPEQGPRGTRHAGPRARGGTARCAPHTGTSHGGREGQPRGRAAVRVAAWRCPEGRDDAHLGPDRREPLRAVEDLRRGRLGCARGAQRPDRAREHADRHAFRGACGPQGRRHRGRTRGARRHRSRRRAPQRGGGREGHRRPVRRGFGRACPTRPDADALRVPRGGVRERHRRAGRHHPGAHLRRGRARRRPPAPAGGGVGLAARRVDAGLAAAVNRGRGPHRAAGRRGVERRLAGRAVRRPGARDPRQCPARPAHPGQGGGRRGRGKRPGRAEHRR